MKLEGKKLDMETNTPIVVMNDEDAKELGVHTLDRVRIISDGMEKIAVADTTGNMVKKGKLGLTKGIHSWEGPLEVRLASKPESVKYIKEKMRDHEWDKSDIKTIIDDINRNALSDIEMGAYVTAIYSNGMSLRETAHLTEAMVEAGEKLEWDYDIMADKHSIGGVPGNRVTPIIIPIIASKGIKIPKTSSRAITSPAGTADTMEAICDVDFDLDEIREIVDDTDGCLVWGGSVKLSPVDDKIIRAEHPLSLDPEGQVIASVLSKKKAAGSNHIVIDIPYGEGSKVGDLGTARDLGKKFKKIGDYLDMNVECTITKGEQPIGRGIGPSLEIRDCIRVLEGNGPRDLEVKSIRLANLLLKMCGEEPNAEEMINNGKALEKFREIVERQNGKPDISEEDLNIGKHTAEVKAKKDGVVSHIENTRISSLGSRTGAPKDKGAGLYIHKKKGDKVDKGDSLMTVYAEKKEKIEETLGMCEENNGFRILTEDEMLIEEV